MIVALSGDWTARDDSVADANSVRELIKPRHGGRIAFEAGQLGRWDSTLLIFIETLRQAARDGGLGFDEQGLPTAATRLLALTARAVPGPPRARRVVSLLDRIGLATVGTLEGSAAILTMVGDTVLSVARLARVRMRGEDLLTCVLEAGADALPIVTVVNALVGGIIAFVGAVQLRRLGAGIYIADLIGVAMVREMAALMTAIIMSGRTGGAYAAHIATMVGNEEIDALQTIGIPVTDYLVLPRILALTTMMPLLYLYGCAVGILGGLAVAALTVDMSAATFVAQMRGSLQLDQFVFGLIKSLTFGALIALVGCRSGLRAGRSAADVGAAATRAVVISIVGVIAVDAIFAVCANALDI